MGRYYDSQLEDYKDAYLACRDLGHAWAEMEIKRSKHGRGNTITRVCVCARCNGSKIDVYNLRGEKVERTRYRPATGYSLVAYRPLSAEVRARRFINVTEQLDRDEVIDLNDPKYHLKSVPRRLQAV